MRTNLKNGFSLLELMVVLVIIGVFSALAIPGAMEIRYRNILTDSVERVRSAAAATRDLAMQTRKAAVLEVSSDRVWINVLSDARCDDPIEKRCTTNLGGASDGSIVLWDADGMRDTAGVAFCGGWSIGDNQGDCTGSITSAALAVDDGFALCYSGAGELFYRVGADTNTVCGGTSQSLSNLPWNRACSVSSADTVSVSFSDSSGYGLGDGAVLMLNRYDPKTTLCTSAAIDNRRLVIFPTNGSPFSIIGGDNGDTETN
jgi:prepilin-type N-terminal cleavage/methylation domain-containing protein